MYRFITLFSAISPKSCAFFDGTCVTMDNAPEIIGLYPTFVWPRPMSYPKLDTNPMCGRAYETYTEDELYLRYLNEGAKRAPLGFKPNYNLAPTQLSPVVVNRSGLPEIALLRWGLVPAWAKDIQSASKYSLINARGEEILEKRSYQQAFLKRRCILPLSGFIEWKRESEKVKRPFAIHLKGDPIMSVAGVWEHWVSPATGEIFESFSIITTAANSMMQKIHDRMPVILSRESEAEWLDPKNQDPARLKQFLKPCPPEWLAAYEISTAINSPRNNQPELLNPLQYP
ncbi:MAG: SOS response-associated peptidase [Bdellovibrionales bacterium]|nr:SOS response-associated peptidase [Bdellovibrionales bacterium]